MWDASVALMGGAVPDTIERLISFRNQAEELRIIADGRISAGDCEALLRVAPDYDRMAASLGLVIKSKATRSRRQIQTETRST
jgi:hypothetical protein